ncbi:MAG: NAD-dependent deacylase [Betaproteobacteria bacterium]|nr:NAD-dependent deacylase [Betaproteobacteria bacterium]MBK6601198.1 NAD-dependent deacylase [Betaproteobacteria bacterium]MBK7079441.1 NAD-dependent deacylase [Betaproteobacteria bacterium]MBK7592443.1 NAD-dependent deacylase [Betaproteobacteria bacterium]MBK7743140.1 NAD-dependent deacylase [Betaproteobacteria bacterium]
MSTEDTIARIAELLRQSRRILFVTGAGISADSGLPTYRGVAGLYEGKETEEGLPIEAALSGEVFALRPDITWKYLAQIERNCRGARPNAAHRAIAELERRLARVQVFTQNVDGLHRKAGSRDLIEVHGSLDTLHCPRCRYRSAVESLEGRDLPPQCPRCGSVLRPDIVLFGESLPEGAIDRLLATLAEGVDMVFAIGTTAVFPYVAHPVMAAARARIPTVEINPAPTRLSEYVEFRLRLGAAEAMTTIMARLEST